MSDWLLVLVLSPAYGVAVVTVPAVMAGLGHEYDSWMWGPLWNSIRSVRLLPTAVLLCLGGFLLERWRAGRGLAATATAMGVFVVGALVGAAVQPGTHNLLPFELVVYAVLSGIFLVGAVLARTLRNRRSRSSTA